jgi:hypothetical protein
MRPVFRLPAAVGDGQNNDCIRQYAVDEIVGVAGKNESPGLTGDGWRGERERGDGAARFLDPQPEPLRRAGTAFANQASA